MASETQNMDMVVSKIESGRVRLEVSVTGRFICRLECEQIADPNDVLGALNCLMNKLAAEFEVNVEDWQGEAELLNEQVAH